MAAQPTRASPSLAAAGGARRFSTRQVEEVKLVLRLLPVFATTALYWTIYMQARRARVPRGRRAGRGAPAATGAARRQARPAAAAACRRAPNRSRSHPAPPPRPTGHPLRWAPSSSPKA